MVGVVTGMRWYLIVVLTCVSLTINDIEHLFICLLVNCVSSLDNCLSLPLIFYWIVFFLYILNCMRCLYIVEINPLNPFNQGFLDKSFQI